MPPKANRQPKRAEDSTPKPKNKQLGFVDRVHLPALQDTPSSRRQYSYGAAVEPMAPRRFTGDYADKPYTLKNAISNALERQARELEQERINFPQPAQPNPIPSPSRQPKSRTRKTMQEPDMDDELASAAFPPPRKGDSVAPSDADDARSFGIESDVYGDATIASTPDVTNDTGLSVGQRSVNRREARRRISKGLTDPAFRDTGSDESSGDELGLRRSTRRRKESAKPVEQQQEDGPPPTKVAFKLPNGVSNEAPQSAVSRSSSDRSPETRPTAATRSAPANGTSANKTSPKSLARYAQLKQAEAEQRRRTAEQEAETQAARLRATQAAEEDSYSDRSEQDSALQEDIQAREDAISSESEGESHLQRWQQRWDSLQSLSPSNYLRRYRQVPVTHEDDDETEESPAGGWRKLFSLHTYLDALSRFLSRLIGFALTIWRFIISHSPSLYRIAAFILLANILLAVLPAISDLRQPDDLFENSAGSSLDFWGSLGSIIPAITHPFRSRIHDSFKLSDFEEDGKFQLEAFLESFTEQFGHLKSAGAMNHQSIVKLQNILPKVVHMQLQDGKPIVAQEFWHALRELIHDEDSILTVQDDGKLPEKQWRLVSSRILDDTGLQSKLSNSVGGAEARMEEKISNLWDSWVKENNSKLQAMLDESVEKLQSLGTDQELNVRIARIIKEQSKADTPSDGVFVTKDEFLKHLKNEFAVHGSEIRAQLNELQPQVEQLVLSTIEKHGLNKHDAGKLGEEARAEVYTLINKAISDALANVNIEALARGEIQSHWEVVLKNRINFFSMGSGATVNMKHSSATYDPYGKGVIDRQDLKNGLRGAKRWHQSEALMDWSEDGDKWCAAREINLEGKPHGYMLAVQLNQPVIPQQVVVEHILPGATIDPDARPRDIEIYAQIEDPEVRERVRDFSATHVTQHIDNEVTAPLNDDMVRIGRFTYAGAELHDGVYVHQLHSELTRLGAETSEVVIRAVNNYGAEDHTCFYRVRMYGQAGEGEVVVEEPEEEKSFWQRVSDSW